MLAAGARRPPPDRASVLDALADFGMAVEGVSPAGDLTVEALMNRPDLFSVEGVARALRPFLGLGPSPDYAVAPGGVSLTVDASVAAIRPEIASAVVRGVTLDDDGLRRLFDTQEKLDLTYGRRRSRVSIGLHDLGPLTPAITYKAVLPDAVSFVPLFAESLPGGPRAVTPREILELHPKGREYAPLLGGKPLVPLLVDSKGQVLSMPPIINGTLTELKVGRHDLFLDVTGTAREPVQAAAKLLAFLLVDRGGTLESVEVHRQGEPPAREPSVAWTHRRVSLSAASRLVGARLHADEAATALGRMGHRPLVVPGGADLDVGIAPWRFDILHEVDLIEDVAVGLGYRNVAPSLPRMPTTGEEAAVASLARRARTALLGLGFLEVMTLTLGTAEAAGAGPAPATVANPITADHSALRTSLLPSLLAVLAANTHRDLPQAVFEVGDVVLAGRNETRLAGAYVGSDASFTRVKGLVASLAGALGLPLDLRPGADARLTRGRCAVLEVGGRAAGAFGEIAPAVLDHHSLSHPAAGFEFTVSALVAPRSAPPAPAPSSVDVPAAAAPKP